MPDGDGAIAGAINETDDSAAFSGAFNEAAGIGGKGGEGTGESQLENTDQLTGEQSESDEKPEGEALETTGEVKSSETSETASAEQPKSDSEKVSALEQALATANQRFQTLEGMFRAERDAWARKEAELTSKPQLGPVDENAGLTDDEKALLKEYEEEFDTVSKAESLRRKALETRLRTEIGAEMEGKFELFRAALNEVAKAVQETVDSNHFGKIKSVHKDFESLRDSGKIKTWIESQPKYLQPSLKAAYSEGEADDVIDLITRFKQETGLDKKQPPPTNLTQKNRLQNITVVSDRRAPVSPETPGKAQDFSGAFNEALRTAGIGEKL